MTRFRLSALLVTATLCASVTASSAATPSGVTTQQDELASLRAAAAKGDAKAMYDLGRAYDRSKPRDLDQAEVWIRKAAVAGNADAMVHLGILYENVMRPIPQDLGQAAAWYRKATEQGHGSAMYMLGILCWGGRGVPQDFVEAYKWMDLASIYGTGDTRQRAADVRDSLARANTVSPRMILDGQKRAREWKTAFEGHKK